MGRSTVYSLRMRPGPTRKGRPIAVQMIASAALLLVVVLAVFLVIARVQLRRLAHEQAEARGAAVEHATKQTGVAVSRTIAVASSVALAEGGYTFIAELLATTVRSSEDVRFAVVTDESGRIVADSRQQRELKERKLSGPVLAAARALPPGEVGELPAESGGGVRLLVTPISGRDELADEERGEGARPGVIGYVEVGMATGVHERQVEAARRQALAHVDRTSSLAVLAAAGLLVLGIALAIVQSLGIARPLRRLSAQATQIAHGQINRVTPSGAAELRELSHNLNHMADRLGALLEETAQKASLAKEVEVAQLVQKSLVPWSELISADEMDLLGFYAPASKCGGDWWLWRRLENGRLLLLIGDVTGHGLPTALIAAAAIGAAQTLPVDVTPDRALLQLNEAVRRARGEFMMSCFAAVIDPDRAVVEFSNAGHPFPYVVRRAGGRCTLSSLVVSGPLLGCHEHPKFRRAERPLSPGDVIVLYTDGVTESRGIAGDLWGERRMQRALVSCFGDVTDGGEPRLATLPEVRERLVGTLTDFAAPDGMHDDVTLVLALVHGAAAQLRATG